MEGLPDLSVEQAFELTDAAAERSAAAACIKLSESSVATFLRSNAALMRKMIVDGYQDAGTLQRRILHDAAASLKPRGIAVYSTCSIWPEENELRVAEFLAQHPEYRLRQEERILPSLEPDPAAYHDGGYVAVLERLAANVP
jgi:16S rRNA C967 or C1407 C5-methylase (RsmB/RsmF family)